MSDAAPDPAAAPDSTSLAVRCVRALMERHGLPKYRQSAWLADATGLSYSQAHRRLSGAAPWTLEELERVGALFGERIEQVVALGQSRSADEVPAVMTLGSTTLQCRLWIGEVLEAPAQESVVAVRTSTGWAAVSAAEATSGPAYRIERIEPRSGAGTKKVVAVLDDDKDLTDTICEHLLASGHDARPFYDSAALLKSSTLVRYDGYVVDWIVGETSALELIAALRSVDAVCPIIVLTAQVLSGLVDEADIADAVRTYNLGFSEKPVRMSILSAMLARAFAPAPAPPA
jgi:ActR/RegA family two-component response regulator